MVIYVKNPKLKARIFKSIHYWENRSMVAYTKGQMTKGKSFERKADKLYKDNYKKMFGRR